MRKKNKIMKDKYNLELGTWKLYLEDFYYYHNIKFPIPNSQFLILTT